MLITKLLKQHTLEAIAKAVQPVVQHVPVIDFVVEVDLGEFNMHRADTDHTRQKMPWNRYLRKIVDAKIVFD